jgi:hypothetical protein
MGVAEARERILVSSGTHFDPAVVAAFLALLDGTPDFTLPPRVSPLPVRMAAYPAWMHHDGFED